MSYYCKEKPGQAGFTLVELSIVLVIIGFLISGIVAANSMIKQAELRSVMSDFRTYATAYNNFIGKYNAVPGDWDAAYSVFGATDCTPNTCNGNNNGTIEFSTIATGNEVKKAMRVLGLSGFINGRFDATEANTRSVIGVNAPASKIDGAGYVMVSNAGEAPLDSATPFNFKPTQNFLLMGREYGTEGTLATGALKPSDAHNLDSKMDDGSINSSGNFTGARSGGLMAATSPDADNDCINPTTDIYTITTLSSACVIGFALN
jgi:prepilin-type N-terminal cleavage/methylation domain-containing protein